ncbi:MAG TPA: response regulator transcription factor, partial [Chitinophagaceae bacterium]
AYECYLTSQIGEAIIYQKRALEIRQQQNDPQRITDAMRFLSRLWWYEGNRQHAFQYAVDAVNSAESLPASKSKGMAYSNFAQLKMVSGEMNDAISWAEKAIAIAEEIGDDETIVHALINVGTAQTNVPETRDEGFIALRKSLAIAVERGFSEHAARAYTNLGTTAVAIKSYALAAGMLDEGIRYCEERDLHSWSSYMLSWKALAELETGNWSEARSIVDELLKSDKRPAVVRIPALVVRALLLLRTGEGDPLPLLAEAKKLAFRAMELQRIVPVVNAYLEYEWLTSRKSLDDAAYEQLLSMTRTSSDVFYNVRELRYWAKKTGRRLPEIETNGEFVTGQADSRAGAKLAASQGSTYEQAMYLLDGSADDKRNALLILQEAGATAVVEKVKFEMRASGIRKIPRGKRQSTRSNPGQLTNRELDVLRLLHDGGQNKEIADALFISAKTVDHHISSIFYKLEVNSRTKAVAQAKRLNILK